MLDMFKASFKGEDCRIRGSDLKGDFHMVREVNLIFKYFIESQVSKRKIDDQEATILLDLGKIRPYQITKQGLSALLR